jgi:hypothetical protein
MRVPSRAVTGADQQTQSCTDSHQCWEAKTVEGRPVRRATPRALVPAEVSSHRPPTTNPTPSAMWRIR